jgi:hypothetical protein
MQCKRESIRQKSKVKNLPKISSARNPQNCLCSLEQLEAVEYLFKTHRTPNSVVFLFQVR